jgi:hypothetical protein
VTKLTKPTSFCHTYFTETLRFLDARGKSSGQNSPISPRRVGPQKNLTKLQSTPRAFQLARYKSVKACSSAKKSQQEKILPNIET